MPPLVITLLGTTLPGFSQTFLAEWTAAGNGGVAPTGMALAVESGTTYVYVSDHPRGRILKFNAGTGAVAAVLGSQGSGNGQFNQPYGIAIEPTSGDLYVAERGNHRVQRITKTGAFVMAWGTPGTAQGQFNEPIGVAIDAAGDIYVTEHTNHRVQKFRVTQSGPTWSAANLAMWGSQGTGNGQFNTPYGIHADAAGNIWVADGMNGRVQRFNTSGVYQSTLGAAGTAPGQFVIPTGVTTDPSGAVYVSSTNSDPNNGAAADANSQWVSKFTAVGTFVSRFGGANGSGPGQFKLPFSSVVTADRAYVADFGNSRVQVFNLTATPPADTTAPTVASFTAGTATGNTVNFTLTFSEPVSGIDAADITATASTGATATIGTITGTGATRTIPVTFTGTGTITLAVAGGATANITDAAGNLFAGGAGATSAVFTIPTGSSDTTAPTVNITVASSTATSVTYTVTFSESVTGGAAAAFTATGAGGATGVSIASVTPDASTPTTSYTVVVSYTGTAGTVTLAANATANTAIKDASNNFFAGAATTGGATSRTHTITAPGGGTGGDTTRPTITKFELDAASATATSATMVVTFSEPVTGVEQTDFEVKGTPNATATITGVTAGSTAGTYNVAFNYTGTGGSLQMAIKTAGTGIADAAGNAFVGGGIAASPAYPVNNAPPSDMTLPAISSFATPTGTVTSPINLALVFSEAVTGLTADDFVVSNGATIGAISGSGTTWTVPVSFTGTNPVSVMLVGGATSNIRDAATHWFAGGSTNATLTFTPGSTGGNPGGGTDTTAPTVTSLTIASSTANSVTYQIVFSEAVTGVNSADFTAVTTGGATAAVGTMTGSGTTYTIPVTFTGTSGTVQLNLNASGTGIADAAGNALVGGKTGPVHTIGATGGDDDDDDDGKKGSGPVVVIKRGDGLVAGQPFTLPATTASGQPITWILVSGNATLNGNVVTPKNRGAVVVRAVVNGTNAGRDYKIDDDDDDDEDDDKGGKNDDKKDKKENKGKAPHKDRLSNLSSRLRVSSTDANRSAIAGFVVTGNTTKQVLVRAIGPGLAAFGINEAVPAARLQLHDQSGAVIAQNDGWKGDAAIAAAAERVGAFKLSASSRDSALLMTLRPGAYTAQVGATGSGITLLEVYDATGAAELSTEQLINISTRGYVDSGDGNLIAGFVVTGDAPKRVLIRGIGAALAGFGVAGALGDPVLELYTAGGTKMIARNDNWETAQQVTGVATTAAEVSAAARATGAFPLASGSKDAAILVTLMPGSYSAVVSGANRATGAGLVEVYEVPNP